MTDQQIYIVDPSKNHACMKVPANANPEKQNLQVGSTQVPLTLDAVYLQQPLIPIHLQYAKFPKPWWPKSSVAIPSTFFRDINRRVCDPVHVIVPNRH